MDRNTGIGVELHTVIGRELVPHIPDLARLRLAIFREYPYLYDGDEQYEARYLRTYSSSEQSMAVLAIETADGAIVGASTGIPMQQETEEFKKPFREKGIDPGTLFYCGESVLLPEYRGKGLYRGFMAARERYARSLGLSLCCFCAVVRPEAHPQRPARYQPLDAIWRRFGYVPDASLITFYPWREIGQEEETMHPMMFWCKSLAD